MQFYCLYGFKHSLAKVLGGRGVRGSLVTRLQWRSAGSFAEQRLELEPEMLMRLTLTSLTSLADQGFRKFYALSPFHGLNPQFQFMTAQFHLDVLYFLFD